MSGAVRFPAADRPPEGAGRRDAGFNLSFTCMGCQRLRALAGSRGAGVRRRCAACLVAARQGA